MTHAFVVVVKNINIVVGKDNTDLYIGIMSGTSLDGVDAVIYNFANNSLLGHCFIPYKQELKNKIKNLTTTTLANLASVELEISNIYLQATKQLIKEAKINPKLIKAIGLHGQTIYHKSGVYSKQIGLGSHLAYNTKITTINDFRTADILAAGSGAPLVPKYHQYLLNGDGIVVNLGGIANITKIENGNIIGFDTGPANTLIDNYVLKHFNLNYDKDGSIASKGVIIDDLLNKMINDEYFNLAPPKSTGVEYFNLTWLDKFLTGKENTIDVVRTLTELTAISVTDNFTRGKVYLCGGGAYNKFLMQRMQDLRPNCQILTTEVLGIRPNLIESIAFAYLAKLNMENKTANIPSVTGAKEALILGTKYYE